MAQLYVKFRKMFLDLCKDGVQSIDYVIGFIW